MHLEIYRLHADGDSGTISFGPPPDGYPDGNRTRVMLRDGQPEDLNGKVEGAVIETVLEPLIDGSRRLGFRINRGPLLPSAATFAPDVALYKWAFVLDPQDQLVEEQM